MRGRETGKSEEAGRREGVRVYFKGPKVQRSLCGMIDVRDVVWAQGDQPNPTSQIGTRDDSYNSVRETSVR